MHAGIITVLASSAEQLTIDNINILLPTIQQVTTISGTFRIHIAIANYWLYSYIYIVMRCIGYAGAAVLLCMVAIAIGYILCSGISYIIKCLLQLAVRY